MREEALAEMVEIAKTRCGLECVEELDALPLKEPTPLRRRVAYVENDRDRGYEIERFKNSLEECARAVIDAKAALAEAELMLGLHELLPAERNLLLTAEAQHVRRVAQAVAAMHADAMQVDALAKERQAAINKTYNLRPESVALVFPRLLVEAWIAAHQDPADHAMGATMKAAFASLSCMDSLLDAMPRDTTPKAAVDGALRFLDLSTNDGQVIKRCGVARLFENSVVHMDMVMVGKGVVRLVSENEVVAQHLLAQDGKAGGRPPAAVDVEMMVRSAVMRPLAAVQLKLPPKFMQLAGVSKHCLASCAEEGADGGCRGFPGCTHKPARHCTRVCSVRCCAFLTRTGKAQPACAYHMEPAV